MIILALGEILEKIEEEQVMSDGRPSVLITDSRHAPRAKEMAGMVYDLSLIHI